MELGTKKLTSRYVYIYILHGRKVRVVKTQKTGRARLDFLLISYDYDNKLQGTDYLLNSNYDEFIAVYVNF